MGAKSHLCCLPLRLGVLVISFLQVVASALATTILIDALVLDASRFIGAVRKKEFYVAMFSGLLRFFFVIQTAVVVAYFVRYFVDKAQFRKLCIGDSTDQNVTNACDSPSKLSLWILIVSAVVPLLFQAYGVYIVSQYLRKLHNESVLQQESFGFKGPGYAPVPEENLPLTNQPGYLYTDKAHSFGQGQV
ncbi:hypothetical protein DFH07DRAFT_945580 [Mycena maculata]|uniref:Uncharacterized protein n=1 Tax=Mycena maculata TaxID=230809 RepID=A0AAD7HWC4_9AGAR|nr:hypothetical protein DFH07DRAFT_945580 [Mycena maculata]